MITDRLPLVLVPQELRRMKLAPVPSYRMLRCAAVDTRIPAVLGSNGRWTVARDDLRKIVAALKGPH